RLCAGTEPVLVVLLHDDGPARAPRRGWHGCDRVRARSRKARTLPTPGRVRGNLLAFCGRGLDLPIPPPVFDLLRKGRRWQTTLRQLIRTTWRSGASWSRR